MAQIILLGVCLVGLVVCGFALGYLFGFMRAWNKDEGDILNLYKIIIEETMETKNFSKEGELIDVFMDQAAFYQKALHDLVLDYQQKGLDVSTMSLVHCEMIPKRTRVGRSFLAAPADILSMLDDIDKAFPEIIGEYVLVKKIV